jgi:hypothetical protein
MRRSQQMHRYEYKIQLWYREDTWPSDRWAPYQVVLDDDGYYVFARVDDDSATKATSEPPVDGRLYGNAFPYKADAEEAPEPVRVCQHYLLS